MQRKAHVMPDNPELPESRAEATTARGHIKELITELPSKLGRWPLQNHVILLIMIIFAMGAGALFFQQKQMSEDRMRNAKEVSELRAESAALRVESNMIRDKLTEYLVTANVSTTGALDRNTIALAESNRIMHRMEVMLDALKERLKN